MDSRLSLIGSPLRRRFETRVLNPEPMPRTALAYSCPTTTPCKRVVCSIWHWLPVVVLAKFPMLLLLKPAGTLLPRLALNSNQMKSIFLLSGGGGSRTRKNLILIRLSVRWFFIRATLLASSPQCLPIPPRTRCFKTAARFATGGVTVKSKFVFTSEKTVGAAGLEPAISFCLTPEKACTPSNFSGQKRLPIPPRPLFLNPCQSLHYGTGSCSFRTYFYADSSSA